LLGKLRHNNSPVTKLESAAPQATKISSATGDKNQQRHRRQKSATPQATSRTAGAAGRFVVQIKSSAYAAQQHGPLDTPTATGTATKLLHTTKRPFIIFISIARRREIVKNFLNPGCFFTKL
jgi:hypothetical protein